MISYYVTPVSTNAKTGGILVTTSNRLTCGTHCPFFNGNGCYAENGPLRSLWFKMSDVNAGEQFQNGKNMLKAWSEEEMLAVIAKQPKGALWRHNQAGDLAGHGASIDADAVARLVKANRGKRGFTYTHKPLTPANLDIIRAANRDGFTINISGNSAAHAVKLKRDNPEIPVVCVLPEEAAFSRVIEHDGQKITVCPATRLNADGKDALPGMNCAACGLCQVRDRNAIVGFPVHGAAKRAAARAMATA